MARYKIWKESIHRYRVKDTETGKISIIGEFVAIDCHFIVDYDKYHEASLRGFKDTGEPEDYFAHIDAAYVEEAPLEGACNETVWYNPFLHQEFRDRVTKEVIKHASIVEVSGNKLKYLK